MISLEVYDYTKPTSRVYVATVVALPSRQWIRGVEVGVGNGRKHRVEMVQKGRSAKSKMQMRSRIKDHPSAIGIHRLALIAHMATLDLPV